MWCALPNDVEAESFQSFKKTEVQILLGIVYPLLILKFCKFKVIVFL